MKKTSEKGNVCIMRGGVAIIMVLLSGCATAPQPSASLTGQPTFESVQKEFQQKAISLLSAQDVSVNDLQAKIAKFANETLGAHPELMRKETERRFAALSQYPATNLTAYIDHNSLNEFPSPPMEDGWMWLMFGWDPEKLAGSAKQAILARQLGPEERYGRLALLNACCPDKVYRLGKGKFADLVVDSLGDLFVIKVEMTDGGVCKPVSVKWMKSKASRTTPSTVPPPARNAGGVQ
jgi:hypothetical protein